MKFKTDWTNYCGVCQQIHEPTVDCAGRPIDWPARQERARAWLKRPLRKHETAGSLVGYAEQESRP